jgi:nitrate/nitrite transporter NarK
MAVGGRLRQRLTLTVACAAQVMMVLDVLIVSVALPSIQHELHLSPAGLEWVVSAYALALAALIPFGGALGDHFGRKRVFMAGVVVFTLASAGCALSVSGGMLIGFRVVQGIGGAVMSSLTLSLISEAYPPEERAAPIGLWAARRVASRRVPLVIDLLGQRPDRGTDRGHLGGSSRGVPRARASSFRQHGCRAEYFRSFPAHFWVRRFR